MRSPTDNLAYVGATILLTLWTGCLLVVWLHAFNPWVVMPATPAAAALIAWSVSFMAVVLLLRAGAARRNPVRRCLSHSACSLISATLLCWGGGVVSMLAVVLAQVWLLGGSEELLLTQREATVGAFCVAGITLLPLSLGGTIWLTVQRSIRSSAKTASIGMIGIASGLGLLAVSLWLRADALALSGAVGVLLLGGGIAQALRTPPKANAECDPVRTRPWSARFRVWLIWASLLLGVMIQFRLIGCALGVVSAIRLLWLAASLAGTAWVFARRGKEDSRVEAGQVGCAVGLLALLAGQIGLLKAATAETGIRFFLLLIAPLSSQIPAVALAGMLLRRQGQALGECRSDEYAPVALLGAGTGLLAYWFSAGYGTGPWAALIMIALAAATVLTIRRCAREQRLAWAICMAVLAASAAAVMLAASS